PPPRRQQGRQLRRRPPRRQRPRPGVGHVRLAAGGGATPRPRAAAEGRRRRIGAVLHARQRGHFGRGVQPEAPALPRGAGLRLRDRRGDHGDRGSGSRSMSRFTLRRLLQSCSDRVVAALLSRWVGAAAEAGGRIRLLGQLSIAMADEALVQRRLKELPEKLAALVEALLRRPDYSSTLGELLAD